jgi:hypothetical protein
VSGGFNAELTANIGAGTPAGIKITGYMTGLNDSLRVQVWDAQAGSPDWVTIGPWNGKASASNEVLPFDAFISMVGVGANLGDIRLRLYNDNGVTDTALTSANIYIDQVFVEFNQGAGSVIDRVYFDSTTTNTGTVPGTDGIPGNPVSTEAAVNTLLATTGLSRVEVAAGSSITFATSHANEEWIGPAWTLGLGGQTVLGGLTVKGASVSGIGSGASEINFSDCGLGTCTLSPFHANECGLLGTITFSAAGNYVINDGHSRIAGALTPIIDTGAAVGNVNLSIPEYWNGIEIQNLNAAGADEFSISGTGQIVYAASSSGAVNQRGDWRVTNTGGVTITSDDNTQGVADIKLKTDDLTFTVANQVDANVKSVSDDITAADNLELQYDTTGLSGDTFPATQAQVGAITVTGAALNLATESYVLTTGTQTANLFSDTGPLDGVRHTHTDTAGAMELYYQFDIGSEGVPATYTEVGYLTGGNDTLGVYAYNWGTTSWEQVGSFVGSGSTTNVTNTYALYTSHVGTGANLGKVRIRYYAASGLTTATLALDQIYISYAVVPISRQTKGTVVDVSPASTGFDTDLTQASTLWDDALLIFTSGSNNKESRPITTYVSANGAVTFDEAFVGAPANGDSFIVYHTHIHPVTQIQSGLATEAKQDIIDANVDAILALLDDPRAEPGQGAPPVNADMATKLDYIYKAWRNKTEQTATTYSLYDDAGTTVDQKATVSDDGTTFTKGEQGAGP